MKRIIKLIILSIFCFNVFGGESDTLYSLETNGHIQKYEGGNTILQLDFSTNQFFYTKSYKVNFIKVSSGSFTIMGDSIYFYDNKKLLLSSTDPFLTKLDSLGTLLLYEEKTNSCAYYSKDIIILFDAVFKKIIKNDYEDKLIASLNLEWSDNVLNTNDAYQLTRNQIYNNSCTNDSLVYAILPGYVYGIYHNSDETYDISMFHGETYTVFKNVANIVVKPRTFIDSSFVLGNHTSKTKYYIFGFGLIPGTPSLHE